jgi:hypothetical protein
MLALVIVLFFVMLAGVGMAAPEMAVAQSDEYHVFIPLVYSSRCFLPESTKAECLR